MNKFYAAAWDFFEDFYKMTGLRAQAPIEFFYPSFGSWLFGKMIGVKGVCVREPDER